MTLADRPLINFENVIFLYGYALPMRSTIFDRRAHIRFEVNGGF